MKILWSPLPKTTATKRVITCSKLKCKIRDSLFFLKMSWKEKIRGSNNQWITCKLLVISIFIRFNEKVEPAKIIKKKQPSPPPRSLHVPPPPPPPQKSIKK